MKGITTQQLFYLIIFLVCLSIALFLSVYGKDLGLKIIENLPSLIPG